MAMHPIFRKKRPRGKLPIPLLDRRMSRKRSFDLVRIGPRSGKISLFRHHYEGNNLLNALAAALDKDDQHNYRKDSSNDANNCYIVHVYSPFSMNEVFVEALHYGDRRRAQSNQEERGKNKKHEREDKFDRCLCRLLLYLLATLSSEGVRVHP